MVREKDGGKEGEREKERNGVRETEVGREERDRQRQKEKINT